MLPNIETLENQAQMGMHTPSQSFRFTVQRKPPNPRRVEKTQWASKYKKRQKDKKKKRTADRINKEKSKEIDLYRIVCIVEGKKTRLCGVSGGGAAREKERERERETITMTNREMLWERERENKGEKE